MTMLLETFWPRNRWAWFALAGALLFLIGMAGRFLYAEWAGARELRRAEEALRSDNYEEAQHYLERSLTYRPRHQQTYLLLARVCRQLGDLERAEEYLDRAADLKKGTSEELRFERLRLRAARDEAVQVHAARNATTLYEQGLREMDQGHDEIAVETFREVLTLDPLRASAHRKLSECLRRLGKHTEADEHDARYKELEPVAQRLEALAVERDRSPDNPAVYHQIGELLYKQSKVGAAMKNLQTALDLDPYYKPTHRLLADFYLKSGNREQAEAHWRRGGKP
jgi:tetratricopeptide (TPR) repeat protein